MTTPPRRPGGCLPSDPDMTLGEYQLQVCRTMNTKLDESVAIAVLGLGLTGEAGEVADLVKKHIGQGHPLDTDKLIDELGDVIWYVAVLAHQLGVSLDAVASRNVRKLRKRYPDGFAAERSMGR